MEIIMVFEHNSTPIIAALGKQRQENPWSLMATQPNQLLTSRFSKRPQKKQSKKVGGDTDIIDIWPSYTHTSSSSSEWKKKTLQIMNLVSG